MKSIFLIVTLFLCSCSKAQNNKSRYVDLIKEICPEAEIIEIESKKDFVEIDYTCNGQLFETGIDKQMKIVFQETSADIPAKTKEIINDRIKKKHPGWLIDEYSIVTTPDTSFYKVEILKDGIEQNVYFTERGKLFNFVQAQFIKQWSSAELSKYPYYRNFSYNFLNPEKIIELPEVLLEISGHFLTETGELICIQDESGIVFRFDPEKEAITGMMRFTDSGDFEDITMKNDSVFVLRSDGTIFSFNYLNFQGQTTMEMIPFNCMNLEGLYYDHIAKKFLAACKDQDITSNSRMRTIYSFQSGKAQPEIHLKIDQEEIKSLLNRNFPGLGDEATVLNPSALAIHPGNGHMFILSAENNLLAVYEREKLLELIPLPSNIYYKPEGLAFFPDGRLILSSEGKKKENLNAKIFILENLHRN